MIPTLRPTQIGQGDAGAALQFGHGVWVGEEGGGGHHVPVLTLVTEFYCGDFSAGDATGEEMRGAGFVEHRGKDAVPDQARRRQVQAEFLVQFAQNAGLR